jgi:hypothetical protein
MSATPSLTGTPPIPIPLAFGIALAPDVTAAAQLLTAFISLGNVISSQFNSPAMLQARKNVDLQKMLDLFASHADEALRTGQLDQVDRDLS